MTLKIGVIGVGMIGQDHIRRLTTVLAGASIVAVSDVDAQQAREVAARVGAEAYATGEALIAAKEVEAVIVASWWPTHAGYVLACIAAGRVLLAVMVAVEMRTAEPIVALRLLGNRLFRSSNGVTILVSIAFLGTLFAVTLYYQDGRGLSALQAGLSYAITKDVGLFASIARLDVKSKVVASGATRSKDRDWC